MSDYPGDQRAADELHRQRIEQESAALRSEYLRRINDGRDADGLAMEEILAQIRSRDANYLIMPADTNAGGVDTHIDGWRRAMGAARRWLTPAALAVMAIVAAGCSSGAVPTAPSGPDPSTLRAGLGALTPKPCEWKTGYQYASLTPTGYDVVDPGPDHAEAPDQWNPQIYIDAAVRWRNVRVPTDITLQIFFRYNGPGQGVGMLPTYGGSCDNIDGISEIHWIGYLKEQRYDAGVGYRLVPTPINPTED
jgi:hypothetical protein